jgi:hypothetical protein
MTSLSLDLNGNGTIHVTTIQGRRYPIRLGKVGRQRAERVREHVAEPESARRSGVEPSAISRASLQDVEGKLRDRLVRAGYAAAVTLSHRREYALLHSLRLTTDHK